MGINEFLKTILEWIYGFVGNYGWAVVLFTLLVRLIVMPFDYKSRVGMRKMQKIAPMQAKLQKKYEKDPDKMNKKLQELYREQRVNPLSSCLPMLISLPILFAMFTAMRMVANEHLAQNAGRLGREFAALEELAQLLGLAQAPEYIESYDISHTFGADNVAGMVVFHNGRPMKKAYKKFAIKGFDGQNDVGSMQEVLQRRFTHYREDPEDSTFKILPDLILLDGGDAQVHAVLPVLAGMHIDVPVFGMVKDSKHRTRAISTGGGEIQINANRQSFTLVSSIQEEVHRFAVSYHHQKHKKSAFNSTLLQIEGIGPAKAKALLKTLKTVTAVREATQEQLAAVPGISRENAKAVYAYYHGETTAK